MSIHRQDASAHMPLGIFDGAQLVEHVPVGPDESGRAAELLAQIAHRLGRLSSDFEILAACHEHPESPAVDCPAHPDDDQT